MLSFCVSYGRITDKGWEMIQNKCIKFKIIDKQWDQQMVCLLGYEKKSESMC